MKTHFVPFLACYSKKMTAFTNMKQFFFGKIRYLFLTYQKCVMVFCLIFSKYFLKIWDFCTRPAFNGLWKHIQMVAKGKFMTQSLNCTKCFIWTIHIKKCINNLEFFSAKSEMVEWGNFLKLSCLAWNDSYGQGCLKSGNGVASLLIEK